MTCVLVWTKAADGNVAIQKWRIDPSSLSGTYFQDLIVHQIKLPVEDHELSLMELAAKYPTPARFKGAAA